MARSELLGFPATPEQAAEGVRGNPSRLGDDFVRNPSLNAGDDQFSNLKRDGHETPWCVAANPHIIMIISWWMHDKLTFCTYDLNPFRNKTNFRSLHQIPLKLVMDPYLAANKGLQT